MDNELRQKNQELTQRLNQLQFSLSAAGLGLWELNYPQRTFKADALTCQIHGIDPELAGDKSTAWQVFRQHIHSEDLQAVEEKIEENTQALTDFTLRYRVVFPDGSIRYICSMAKKNPQAGPREGQYLGAAWDASEEVETERSLKEQKIKMLSSTKMAALGEMSGGIAHEINNPLTVIQARAFQLNQMADMQKLEATKVKQAADSISKTADKIAKIVRSLRSFSRDDANDPFQLFSVSQLINETLEFCKTKFYDHGVDMSVVGEHEELEVECRAIQIQQVLLNLLNNSFDAIQNLEERWISLFVKEHEDSIEIQVTDSGSGIKPEVAAKMMNPFFTTKELGKGTGLGLSISRDIMKNHQGELVYDSTSPHTCFIIRLPRFQKPLV